MPSKDAHCRLKKRMDLAITDMPHIAPQGQGCSAYLDAIALPAYYITRS